MSDNHARNLRFVHIESIFREVRASKKTPDILVRSWNLHDEDGMLLL